MAKRKDIEEAKKIYSEFKYNLPSFEKLDEDFGIAKHIEDGSTFLLRDIRISIAQNLIGCSRFLEALLNPKGVPNYLMNFIGSLKNEDFEEIRKIYNELAKFHIRDMKLNVIYNEIDTIDFIKDAYTSWQDIKVRVVKVLEKGSIDNNEKKSDNVNYFS